MFDALIPQDVSVRARKLLRSLAAPSSEIADDFDTQVLRHGALYVVDFGELEFAPERGGVRAQARTGTLWRIRRTGAGAGTEPPKPLVVPHTGVLAGALFALAAVVAFVVSRLLRR